MSQPIAQLETITKFATPKIGICTVTN